ncbi:uncharacterized protein IAS62_003840 [Cryptococcus decagattii]|uniref:Uncharacterized protein n=1 Tax=Cryptococcus decagattii TaxID=1859122 RepID=A0ABZ2AVD8_9TREE
MAQYPPAATGGRERREARSGRGNWEEWYDRPYIDPQTVQLSRLGDTILSSFETKSLSCRHPPLQTNLLPGTVAGKGG